MDVAIVLRNLPRAAPPSYHECLDVDEYAKRVAIFPLSYECMYECLRLKLMKLFPVDELSYVNSPTSGPPNSGFTTYNYGTAFHLVYALTVRHFRTPMDVNIDGMGLMIIYARAVAHTLAPHVKHPVVDLPKLARYLKGVFHALHICAWKRLDEAEPGDGLDTWFAKMLSQGRKKYFWRMMILRCMLVLHPEHGLSRWVRIARERAWAPEGAGFSTALSSWTGGVQRQKRQRLESGE